MNKKVVKPTIQKLTSRQLQAINQAALGDRWMLLVCINECDSTIDRLLELQTPLTEKWTNGVVAHYTEVGEFLVTYLDDLSRDTLICMSLKHLGRKEQHGK